MSAEPVNDPVAVGLVPEGRRRDATKNRETLLEAAQAAFAEHPNASLDSIAQAAGLSRRALYGHFPDRDGLLREVIDEGARQFSEIAGSAVSDDPRLALAQLAKGLWRAAAAVRASENIAMSERYSAETALALEPLRASLATLTRRGIASGAFRADMTEEVLALLVEGAARAALRDDRITSGDSAATGIKVVLSIVGLSWREQAELFEAHPELVEGGTPRKD
ncbi:TetR/AcrR family transcriptional regulator [Leucobacter komagatae]|uniref:TetR/AcrR family transcriptional regulator n=1 Tax=Leucobacter komagatae TaxID=55969 RepID=UPI0005ACEA73|nr:TetR/AcrR family transcriptional regulator [Leucobacter komagatae]